MHITKNYSKHGDMDFDWTSFFENENIKMTFRAEDLNEIVSNVREYCKEDKFNMMFVLNKFMNNLLKEVSITKPEILELGAATGILTRWILNKYGGNGILVDKNESSYRVYESKLDNTKNNIEYIIDDFFCLQLDKKFDIVCSFGVIEHFENKTDILHLHEKFSKEDGIIIIIVPLDSILTRIFYEVNPELNLGYRELLSKKEFLRILGEKNLEVINIEVSQGYSYDFIGAVCRKK